MGKPIAKKRGPVNIDGVWHYRRRIPDDVRRLLRNLDGMPGGGGRNDKREEKKRLGRDAVRAAAAWTAYDIEVEGRWSQLRAGVVGGLTVVQREAIAGDIYHRWLKYYPDDDRMSWSNASRDLALVREWDEEYPDDDLKMLDTMQRLGLDEELAKRGLVLPTSAWWPLVDAGNRAAQHACRYAMQRSQGDMRPDAEAERYPAWPDPATTTLTGLHGKWVINRRPNSETQKAFLAVVKKLIAFVGYDDVTRLATADIRRWCAALKEGRKVGDRRIREHYLAAIKAILNSAVTMGYLASNVAGPVKVDVQETARKREKGLRDPEIYAILRASLGPFHDDPIDHVRNARRWVPWLLMYSGARASEVTRLESRHIRREDGVDLIDIETSKTGRPRTVPIHSHLIEQGFLEFVASRRGQPLFFDGYKLEDGHTLTIHRTRAEGVSEWIRSLDVMRIQRPVDPRNRVAPSHGFRHRWRTEARRLFMDREVRNYLQGHQIENVGEGYGDVPVGVSAPWIEMFPRFDVSGEELVVHRDFDLGLLVQAAGRMAERQGARPDLGQTLATALRSVAPAAKAVATAEGGVRNLYAREAS